MTPSRPTSWSAANPGELYALRHDIPIRGAQSTPVEGWVERLDPETLAVTATDARASPAAPTGRAGSPPTPTATSTWCSGAGRTG